MAEDFAFVAYRGAPRRNCDHDFASGDPHVPGLTIEVHRFFED